MQEILHDPSLDLAPVRVGKDFASMLSSGRPTVAQREREYNVKTEPVQKIVDCEVCTKCNAVLLLLKNDNIEIYKKLEMHEPSVLPNHNQPAEVFHFQCACTDVIVCYNDGNICAWNIDNGRLVD